jgi:hypothetical protein
LLLPAAAVAEIIVVYRDGNEGIETKLCAGCRSFACPGTSFLSALPARKRHGGFISGLLHASFRRRLAEPGVGSLRRG